MAIDFDIELGIATGAIEVYFRIVLQNIGLRWSNLIRSPFRSSDRNGKRGLSYWLKVARWLVNYFSFLDDWC